MDENETFVSQRKDPKLALVVPHFEDGKYLCLTAPKMKTLKVDIQADNEEFKMIRCFIMLCYIFLQLKIPCANMKHIRLYVSCKGTCAR